LRKCYNRFVKRPNPPRYSHKQHTFRRRPHSETSYALLVFVVLVAMVVLAGFTVNTMADMTDPVTGDIRLQVAVVGQPPASGAVITTPQNGQHYTDPNTQVAGVCTPGTLVKVYKNNILAGTTLCNPGGRFALTISLFGGTNILRGNNYNAADQPGPSTTDITVVYDAPPAGRASGPAVSELVVTSSGALQSAYTGDQVQWPISVTGGVAPYAIYITWGDGTDNVYSRALPGTTPFGHSYDRPGPAQDSYQINVTVTDAAGHQSTLVLTGIGRSRVSGLSGEPISGGRLGIAWPVLTLSLFMILCFWLGEFVADRYLRNHEKKLVFHQ
jgi:hypothetical protein